MRRARWEELSNDEFDRYILRRTIWFSFVFGLVGGVIARLILLAI